MTVKTDLIELVEQVAQRLALPPIKQIYIPEPLPGPDRHTEFGVIELEDGAAGLYYAWLGDSQRGMRDKYPAEEFVGKDPMDLVRYFNSDDEADCSLALAAINAITQSIFHRAHYHLDTAADSMGQLDIANGDHIGMVGYFPSLVRQLGERKIRLTVIEKKTHFVKKNDLVEVTLDPAKLTACNKVISTAATLLNDSVDSILDYAKTARVVVMVGPTAGFFPDPLFKRGVAAVGGAEILDATQAIERLRNDQGLGESARKYVISNSNYPGIEQLLQAITPQDKHD